MKTIQMTIDEPLLKALDKASRARKTTRSAFIRDAVELALQRQSIEEQELRHAQGYKSKPIKAGEFDVWSKEQDWGAA
jgi:metal-responsive CopG/Arc/MetJ family transcriptional regulator